MKGRNYLKINTATLIEALDNFLEPLLDAENVKIDTVEYIEDEDGLWYQLALIEPGTDE